jgi:hypothetical protein
MKMYRVTKRWPGGEKVLHADTRGGAEKAALDLYWGTLVDIPPGRLRASIDLLRGRVHVYDEEVEVTTSYEVVEFEAIKPPLVFDCTPEQYHADLDKLWGALGLTGPQDEDVFTLAAKAIHDLTAASEAMVRWFDAEEENPGTFWDRVDLCKYTEWIARKALGQEVGDYAGVPKLIITCRHQSEGGE